MHYSPDTAKTIITLFKGVIYLDKQAELWQILLRDQAAIKDYIAVIGLELFIDESEGFAFLRQKRNDEHAEQEALPSLISRRPLSYPVSLLCVLLRKKIAEQDASSAETRTIINREQIISLMRIYLQEKTNEIKIVQQIDQAINKLIDLGFLRPLANQESSYEIKRVIKALVDANWLADINQKLREYENYEQASTN